LIDKSYTRALRRYDRDLFAEKNRDGVLCVFRLYKRYEPVCVTDDFKFLNLIKAKQFVFALTENWTLLTKPRMWGIDQVLNRIREMDLRANERFFEEMDAAHERADESERRRFKNDTEAFLADNRKQFADAFDSFSGCLHSVSKDEPRKRKKDRSIKNGNC